MSVDSTALERSALERKDRDELVTIAQALGGKPAARAAKATIINLILELTGVAPSDAPPAKATRARKAAAPKGDAAPVDAPEADEPPIAEAADDAAAAEPAPVEPAEAEEAADGPDDAADEADDDPADAAGDDEAEPAPARRDGGRPQGGQGQGGQPAGGQGQQQGQGEDGDEEGGNRRRRRRGRNRDRNGEPGQGQGQGGAEEWVGDPVDVSGVVDLRDEGYGFLRVSGFLPSRDDAYISVKQARQFGLRRGDVVAGASRPALRNEKNPALLRIDQVNGGDPDQSRGRRRFDDLTPIAPGEALSVGAGPLAGRVARGQRTIVAGPHGAGKTELVQELLSALGSGDEAEVLVLAVDARPEEAVALQRAGEAGSAQVVTSTFDRPADEHAQVADLVVERAKRLVESGADVVVVVDGLAGLARAQSIVASGRAAWGTVDGAALTAIKRIFGAARNAEEGGSLTLVATALAGTGSAIDEVVLDELRSAANLEVRLDGPSAE